MKPLPVAPAPDGVPTLLLFLRDVLDRLTVWRLTERDEAVLQVVEGVQSDLLARCARLGKISHPEGCKIIPLPRINNRGNNPSARGSENA
jgi:hypothetical protein